MPVETWIDSRGERWSVRIARGRRERMWGLLGSRPGARDGLLLPRCRSVHSVGLRFPIEAILLEDELRVLEVVRLSPARLLWPRRSVRHVLEVAEGSGLLPGDRFRRVVGASAQPKRARTTRLRP